MSEMKKMYSESGADLYNHRELRMILELQDRLEKDERTIGVLLKTTKTLCYMFALYTVLLMIFSHAISG